MAFLLDTCALSEFVVAKPDPKVVTRLRTLPAAETFIPSFAIGEIKEGIERLAPSARREKLAAWLYDRLLPAYLHRIIPFDRDEALRWGELRAHLHANGYAMETEDSLIAAVALAHDLTLVTRNTAHFAHAGVRVYNPWSAK